MTQKIGIIGAWPGGLTAAMILSHRGYDVTVLEKQDQVGGRNGEFSIDGFRFDIGPTFLMMRSVLDDVFELAWAKSDEYLEFILLEHMYRLHFGDTDINMYFDKDKMRQEIKRLYPDEVAGFDRYLQKEGKRFEAVLPCLSRDYSSLKQFVNSKDLIKLVPHLWLWKSVYDILSKYFSEEKLRLAFTFQAKYLGMSPWQCPAIFTILSYIEHQYGIYHIKWGLSEISRAMAIVSRKNGTNIRLSTAVKKCHIDEKRNISEVELENGEMLQFDQVILNADFWEAMMKLFEPQDLKKWTPQKLDEKKYSCSTYMMYIGLDTIYDTPFHQIVFADNYKENIEKISRNELDVNDFSLYVRNASIIDETLAPKWKSGLYILIPVANQRSGVDWSEYHDTMRENALDILETKAGFPKIREHIVVEKTLNPSDWQAADVYAGSTFNLAHTLDQMIYFRPRNKFEEFKNCYIVGWGTHPGSGLPTIYESARIVADMIEEKKSS